jgi:type IV secretion system protein TrbB
MTPTKLLIGQFVVVFAIVIAGIWFATQWAAAMLAFLASRRARAGLLTMVEKIRHQLFLDKPPSDRLEALAAKPGASKSAILADALTGWLNRRAASELDERFSFRLDRLTAGIARVERDGHIILETLALFIRFELAIQAPLAENDHAGAGGSQGPVRSLRRTGRSACGHRPANAGARSGERTMSASSSEGRRRAMLRTAMGPAIAAALGDSSVIEIMVNPDGALRVDILGQGRVDTEVRLEPAQIERIIRLVAAHARGEVHGDKPIVSAELPPHGEGAAERFEGLLQPVSTAPCFSIRKPAARIYSLVDYVSDGIMSAEAARLLSLAVVERKNILVVGGTSSGKTTLANALLAEMAHLDERVILIEDTRELQCAASDVLALRTRAGSVTMADLVRSTLRLRPDRIIVGEVRGPEVLDMLKAWNTGHPGGIATVHANSAVSALYRIEQLIQEAVVSVPRPLIARRSADHHHPARRAGASGGAQGSGARAVGRKGALAWLSSSCRSFQTALR